MWTDEFITLKAIQLDWRDLIEQRANNGHFPTYFLFLSGWSRVFGESDFSLRMPSALFCTAAVYSLYGGARGALGPKAAIWVALFFIFNERTLWASQEARPYALTMLASAAAFGALISSLRTGRPMDWIVYVIWTLVGLGSQATYPSIFLGQVLVIGVWQIRTKKLRADWLISTTFLLVCAAVMFSWLSGKQTNQSFYNERAWPEVDHVIKGLNQIFWGEYDIVWSSGAKYLGIALALFLTVAAWRARHSGKQEPIGIDSESANPALPVFGLGLAWAISSLVIMALVSGLAKDVMGGFRYYAIGAGGAALLQGMGIAGLKRPGLKWSVLALCTVLNGVTCVAWLFNPGDGAREAIQFVAEHRETGEPTIFCTDKPELMAMHYGLGDPLTPVSRNLEDEPELRRIAGSAVGESDSFWVIYYKEKASPFPDVIQRWSAGEWAPEFQYNIETLEEYDEARALRYMRAE